MNKTMQSVVIGASAGGYKAIHIILSALSAGFPLPVVIVQHRMAGSDTDNFYIDSLQNSCILRVKEAKELEPILSGFVYIAPSGYHLLVEKNHTFSLSVDEPVCYSRPSIDVLFESAAKTYSSGLIGIILTGANNDGSNGIKKIKEYGGITIAQNPETAEVKLMPQSAINTKAVDFILDLENIIPFLKNFLEDKAK